MNHWTKQFAGIVGMVCLVLMTGLKSLAEEGVVTVSNTEWAPYTTKDFPTNGIVPEIISAAYANQGDYRMVFLLRPWARVMTEVKHGKLDGAAAAFYRDDRAKDYLYSDPYMSCTMAFYKRKDLELTTWNSLEDLKPYKIGVIRKSAYSPEFDSADFLVKNPVNTIVKNLELLLNGRIDLMVTDTLVAQHYIRKYFPEHQDEFVRLSPDLYVNSLHIMFSRKVPDAARKAQAFNKGLQAIRSDGTLQKIMESYGITMP